MPVMMWQAGFAAAIAVILSWSLLAHRSRRARIPVRALRPWPDVADVRARPAGRVETRVETPVDVPVQPSVEDAGAAPAREVPAPRDPADPPTVVATLIPAPAAEPAPAPRVSPETSGPAPAAAEPAGTIVLLVAPATRGESRPDATGSARLADLFALDPDDRTGLRFRVRIRRLDIDPPTFLRGLPGPCREVLTKLAHEPSSAVLNDRFRRMITTPHPGVRLPCAAVVVADPTMAAAAPGHVIAVGTLDVAALFTENVALAALLARILRDREDGLARRAFDTALLAVARARGALHVVDPDGLRVDHPWAVEHRRLVEARYAMFIGTPAGERPPATH